MLAPVATASPAVVGSLSRGCLSLRCMGGEPRLLDLLAIFGLGPSEILRNSEAAAPTAPRTRSQRPASTWAFKNACRMAFRAYGSGLITAFQKIQAKPQLSCANATMEQARSEERRVG